MTERRRQPQEPWEHFLASPEANLAEEPGTGFDAAEASSLTKSDADGDWVDADGDWVHVQCPHCFEDLEILLDAETQGRLVQDCEVCCHPWELTVKRQRDGARQVDVCSLD